MSQFTAGYSFTFFTALIVIFGDFAIKIAADAGHTVNSKYVLAGVALYAVSALFWFWAMQHVTLAQAGVAYSMITLIALAVIGAVWFKEPLYLREYAGLGCALLSMVLMSRVA
jgi:undecaprenyl phosphate-alpha-L-ara4N flippase subunit ArnF